MVTGYIKVDNVVNIVFIKIIRTNEACCFSRKFLFLHDTQIEEEFLSYAPLKQERCVISANFNDIPLEKLIDDS